MKTRKHCTDLSLRWTPLHQVQLKGFPWPEHRLKIREDFSAPVLDSFVVLCLLNHRISHQLHGWLGCWLVAGIG